MHLPCPHCHNEIELVGAKEMREEFNISGNTVAHYRDKGFPKPVLAFGNRLIYLRAEIARFKEERSQQTITKTVDELTKALDSLPEAEQKAARALLESKLAEGKSPTRVRSRAR